MSFTSTTEYTRLEPRPATATTTAAISDSHTSSSNSTSAAAAGSNTNNNKSKQEQIDDIVNLTIKPVNPNDVIMSCENIHKTYLLGIEGVPALRGVTCDIYRRDFVVIFGQSGSGKTTLANTFGMIDVPTKGNLQLFDHRITERTPDEHLALLRCKKIGFVFQSFNLLSTMSAMDNVSLPMIIAGERSADEIFSRAKMLLESVGLGHRLQHFPGQLSGGEQQRVTIARALANEPEVLLLDEPTGDLDTKNTQLVLDILMDLNLRKGITMVMVTHDVYMKKYATRVIYFRDGRIARTEEVNSGFRLEAIKELKMTALEMKAEIAATGGPMRSVMDEHQSNASSSSGSANNHSAGGGVGGLVAEVRHPEEYPTFSKKASPRIFFRHEQPVLFRQLFGKHRNDGQQAVLVPETGNNNNLPRGAEAASTSGVVGGLSAHPAALRPASPTNIAASINNNNTNNIVEATAARHGVLLPRRGQDDGAASGHEMK